MSPTGAIMSSLAAASKALGLPGAAAVGASLLAGAALIGEAGPMFRALRTPALAAADARRPDEARLRTFESSFDSHLSRSNGRSMFFIPPEPPPPPPPPTPDEGPREDPPPSSYAGPALIAIVGDVAWFEGGTRLALDDDEARGLDVIDLDAPWSARVRWKGVEFSVPLFDRTTARFLLEEPATETEPTSLEPDLPDQSKPQE